MSSAIHCSWFWNNQSKLMAFDLLLVLGKAFSISEAGLIGVLKYGQDSQGIHSLNEPFTEESFLNTFKSVSLCPFATLWIMDSSCLYYCIFTLNSSLSLKPRLCTRPC